MGEGRGGLRHISVTIGRHKFETDARPDVVSEEFKLFVDAIAKDDAKTTADHAQAAKGRGTGFADLMETVFEVNENSAILRQVPPTDNPLADGLLLLLYGFRKQLKVVGVPSSWLSRAAKDSGLDVGRVDVGLKPHMDLIVRSGKKSGTRYGLKTSGVQKAEALLRELYG